MHEGLPSSKGKKVKNSRSSSKFKASISHVVSKWEAAGWVGGHAHTFRYTQCFLVLGTMMYHVCVLILVSQQKNQGPGQGRERAREPEYLQNAESCCRMREAPQWLPQTNRAGKRAVVRQAHSASQQPVALFGKGTGSIRPSLVLTSIGNKQTNKKRPNKRDRVGAAEKKSPKLAANGDV